MSSKLDQIMDGSQSLEDAREYLRARLREGASCPCCGQTARMYRRSITSSMAYVLSIMARYSRESGARHFGCVSYVPPWEEDFGTPHTRVRAPEEARDADALSCSSAALQMPWIDVAALLDKIGAPSSFRGDFAKLRFWNLIRRADEREDGSIPRGSSGWWQITPTGVRFVQNRESVQKYAVLYDGSLVKVEGEKVNMAGALGESYDYEKMLAASRSGEPLPGSP